MMCVAIAGHNRRGLCLFPDAPPRLGSLAWWPRVEIILPFGEWETEADRVRAYEPIMVVGRCFKHPFPAC